MRKSKTSENIEQNKLVDNIENEKIEKKFEEDLNEIKEKLNSEKLSDEFKENLQAKLEEELNKTNSNDKGKIINFPVITRKLAGICACFVFLCSSCIAFADDIENVIFSIFADTDRIVENAIANGNYKEINMDYVENNGVSIKVDYLVAEDDCLYIAFNVLSEEEFDKVVIDEIEIRNQDDMMLYTRKNTDENTTLVSEDKRIGRNNSIIINKLTNIKCNLTNLQKLKIDINKINFMKDNIGKNKNGNWKCEINM